MKYSKELTIGVSVLVAGILLFFGINYLKGINIFRASNYYYASYTNVAGLSVSAPVTLNGLKVGEVREVAYEYDNPGHVSVEMSLDKNIKVPAGSKAVIESDILGTAAIVLKFSDNAESHAVGDRLIGETAPSMLDGISSTLAPAAESILPKVDSLLSSVNRLVSDSALLVSVKRLDAITANLQAATLYLNRTLATMPATMKTVNGVAVNLDSITSDLAVVSEELKALPLKQTVDNVNAITSNVNDITAKINRPDNTLGLLLNDRQLYDHVNGVAGGLDSIMIELKQNPKKYIPSIKVF